MSSGNVYAGETRTPNSILAPAESGGGGGNVIAKWDRADLPSSDPALFTVHKTSPAISVDATNTTFYLHGVMPEDYAGEALELDLWVRCNTTNASHETDLSVTMEAMAHGEDDSGDSFNSTADTGTVTYTTTAYTLRLLTIALTNCLIEEEPAADQEFRLKVVCTAHDPGTSNRALITFARLRKVV